MRLLQIYSADLLNGEGLREVLFFSGCDHKCPGCFNSDSQNPDCPGSDWSHFWTEEDYQALLIRLKKPCISGVTISGGDGFSKWNKAEILELVKRLKTDLPLKTVWLYTGWTWEEIEKFNDERWEALQYIDVLCDGRYIDAIKSPKKPWVGSDNQRVIDVKKSLESDKVVLFAS